MQYFSRKIKCLHILITFIVRFIVTELCAGNLQEWIKGTYKGPMVLLTDKMMLYQVTDGLAYLHHCKIVHRDIKPQNILISRTGEQMKLADFGISRALKTNDKTDFTNTNVTNPHGTKGWIAPELYQNKRYDFKADIFPLGCVFAYTVSGGKHPFGEDPDERPNRIKKNKPMVLVQEDLKIPHSNDGGVAIDLIKWLLDVNPNSRPTAEDILKDRFFESERKGSYINIIDL